MAAIKLSDDKLVLHYKDVPKGLFPTTEMCYRLKNFARNQTFDKKVITVGKHKKTGLIFAARDNRFYNHPDYKRLASY